MTENEKKLIRMIRESKDPEKAMKIAIDLVMDLLGKKEEA